MNTTESHPEPAGRPTVESDPAYDFADDAAVDEDWDTEDDLIDSEERVVPPESGFIDAEERVVPLDSDEFREPEDES